MSTEKISRRPISIRNAQNHLQSTGSSAQDIVGPISTPSVGPTFERPDRQRVMEFITSTPMAVKYVAANRKRMR